MLSKFWILSIYFAEYVDFATRCVQRRRNFTSSSQFGSLPAVLWVTWDLAMLVPLEWANKKDLSQFHSFTGITPSTVFTGQLEPYRPEMEGATWNRGHNLSQLQAPFGIEWGSQKESLPPWAWQCWLLPEYCGQWRLKGSLHPFVFWKTATANKYLLHLT